MKQFYIEQACESIYSLIVNLLLLPGGVEMRWVDTYFPFTEPSFELEIYFKVSLPSLKQKFCVWLSNLSTVSYITSFLSGS